MVPLSVVHHWLTMWCAGSMYGRREWREGYLGKVDQRCTILRWNRRAFLVNSDSFNRNCAMYIVQAVLN